MKSIIVNVVPEETRMAIIENNTLLEFAVERTQSEHVVGNIYKGKVQNVLPGMQAAFVDIGYDKNAFLYIGDGLPKNAVSSISHSNVFHVGQNVLIQIVKDAIGTKGPRATTHLTLPGRYVVLMPTVDYIGVSRRIEDTDERERLKGIAEKICPPDMGMIVRTVAEGQCEEVLKKDMEYLSNLWNALVARDKVSSSPTLVYRDADLLIRIVRDYLNSDIDELVIDRHEAYTRVCALLSPNLVKRVKLYKGTESIFRHYRIEDELRKLEQREVELKSGGSIVIDKTEALTVIDVNTGKFVGQTNLADTVFRTNMEAAEEITKQIRLRDLGGIIIVDFIDMETEEQRQTILKVLEDKVKYDKTKTNVVDITALGLVEMTRKKSRQNFESILYSTCPYCNGRGRIQSSETVSIHISRDLRRLSRKKHLSNGYIVQVHPQVKAAFEKSGHIANLEKEIACKIVLEGVESLHPEVYSILQAPDD
ncbi:Rne/Rng family ribonuclease [Anaerosinus massiliensis]|uniref:Rne/Rng family ribonuclease n=1 Tax=Massilibacillus massiliensis TaxID=1806837 RepID=UPI000AEB2AC8|nr:Rne/Rng family ribonuclease [Massilibacillus massiliensis]